MKQEIKQDNLIYIGFTDEVCELVKRFLQYQSKWERLFNDKTVKSVHIHKDSGDELATWVWTEKD
jgi:hypothetical protein